MNRISAILTAAASLALGACASDNMTYSDSRGPDYNHTLTHETKTVDGSTVRADGSTVRADGTIVRADGSIVQKDGTIVRTDGTTVRADGTIVKTDTSRNDIVVNSDKDVRFDNMHVGVPDNPQLGGGNDKNVAQGLSESDRKFLTYVLQSGQFEITSGEKALAKSNNAGVRAMAQILIDDHTKAGGQATNLASRRGLRSPISLSTDHIDKLAQLDRLEGAAFDAEFLTQQKLAHDEAVAIFDAAAAQANDKFIRDWAAATAPALRSHREMLDMLRTDKNSVTMDIRFLNGRW
jgi:putative membrane protein